MEGTVVRKSFDYYCLFLTTTAWKELWLYGIRTVVGRQASYNDNTSLYLSVYYLIQLKAIRSKEGNASACQGYNGNHADERMTNGDLNCTDVCHLAA